VCFHTICPPLYVLAILPDLVGAVQAPQTHAILIFLFIVVKMTHGIFEFAKIFRQLHSTTALVFMYL